MDWEEELAKDLPRGTEAGESSVPKAAWCAPKEIPSGWTYTRKSVFLGYRDGKGIGCPDDRHILLVAGSRAGKGVAVVIPNLLLYEGSVLAIDPKGELARVTANRRRAIGDVAVIDPFGVSGDSRRARFNPLDALDPARPDVGDDIELIADALIIPPETGDQHWSDAARQVVRMLIMDALLQPLATRNLAHIRRFFGARGGVVDGEAVSGRVLELRRMSRLTEAFDGRLAEIAHGLAGKPERELGSIISTAEVQTAFLDSKPIADCLSGSDVRIADLVTRRTTIYLCLPASRMASHAKWLRVIITLAIATFERLNQPPDPPALFLLEEFPVLGYVRILETAMGQIAGFGVKMFSVLQDLTQLQKHYRASWETFIGNAGATIWFGNSDATTLDYISKKLGTVGYDLHRLSGAGMAAALSGASPISEQLQLNRLLEPHEVEMMLAREKQRALVLYPGLKPLVLQRARYFADDTFAAFLEPRP
jgi:type IV secretion system protein VirD4